MKKNTLTQLTQTIKPILADQNINFLAVFGSVAKGTNRPDSDLDLVVDFSHKKGLLDLVKLQRELSEKTGQKVDLITKKSISKHMKDSIYGSMKVLYER